jgi:hypothetical protein
LRGNDIEFVFKDAGVGAGTCDILQHFCAILDRKVLLFSGTGLFVKYFFRNLLILFLYSWFAKLKDASVIVRRLCLLTRYRITTYTGGSHGFRIRWRNVCDGGD